MKTEKKYYFRGDEEAKRIGGHICDLLLGEMMGDEDISFVGDKRFRILEKLPSKFEVEYKGISLKVKVRNTPLNVANVVVELYGIDPELALKHLDSMRYYSTSLKEFRNLKDHEVFPKNKVTSKNEGRDEEGLKECLSYQLSW